jgi:hypothetical protein
MAEVVKQVVAVEPGAKAAGLDEPRPDCLRRGVDGDRPGHPELGVREQRVSRERRGDLGRRGPPVPVPPAVQRGRGEEREVADDIGKFSGEFAPGWPGSVSRARVAPRGTAAAPT